MPNKVADDVRIQLRSRTAAAWAETDDILLMSELGLDEDTGLFKWGDGVHLWADLPYANLRPAHLSGVAPTSSDNAYLPGEQWIDTATGSIYECVDVSAGIATWTRLATADSLANLGAGDMLKSTYDANNDGVVDQAAKLAAPINMSLSGHVTGTSTLDGSADVTISATLASSGVTAGTYPKVTVDSYGRVTNGDVLDVDDIPDLTLDKITDAGSAAALDAGDQPGDVVIVGDDGKIASDLIPALPENVQIYTAETVAELVDLTDADLGDIAIIVGENADKGKRYRLLGDDPTVASDWVQISVEAGTVLSVNGQEGPIVELGTGDVPETGSNQYFTSTRATANFNANIATTASTELSDGSSLLHTTDTIIFDCRP